MRRTTSVGDPSIRIREMVESGLGGSSSSLNESSLGRVSGVGVVGVGGVPSLAFSASLSRASASFWACAALSSGR